MSTDATIELVEFAPDAERPYAAPLKRMRTKHVALLLAVAQGETVAEAARLVGMSGSAANRIHNTALFQENLRRIRNKQATLVAEGKFGAKAVFVGAAEEMAIKLVNLARHARSEQVRYASMKDILDRAGLAPIREQHTLNLNALLDQMSNEELDRYVASGQWPDRFRDQVLALLGQQRARPAIDVSPEPPASPSPALSSGDAPPAVGTADSMRPPPTAGLSFELSVVEEIARDADGAPVEEST